MKIIETHCHTTASDGSLEPEELVKFAVAQGLGALCITDHDTILGIPRAVAEANKQGIDLVPGIEIEVSHPSGAFHLLGLGIYEYEGIMEDVLPRILEDRERRNRAIVRKLNSLGVPLEYGDIQNLASSEVVGRPHFATFLVQSGFAVDYPDAFERFLGNGGSAYVSREGLPLKEALDKIHQAGGKAVVAHPASLHLSWKSLKQEVAVWKEMGLDGIEAYHSSVKKHDGDKYRQIAEDLDMIATAGSDFHHPEQKFKKIGHCCQEQLPIYEDVLSGIRR